MNYRHAYHAGNHTEVFKHAVLVHLLAVLREKEKPFFVLDTHSGRGLYDLEAGEARKTAEADAGIARVWNSTAPLLSPYLDIVRQFNDGGALRHYPGSPAIVARLLRAGDRAAMCELHDDDFPALQRVLAREPGTSALHRDGYEAMVALIPPRERRGLVFVDPPYEQKDEAEVLFRHLHAAFEKWPTGIFACWYPVKDARISRFLRSAAAERFLPKSLTVEFLPHAPDGETLAGSGLLIVNTPWNFDSLLRQLCTELVSAFGGTSARGSVEWIREPV